MKTYIERNRHRNCVITFWWLTITLSWSWKLHMKEMFHQSLIIKSKLLIRSILDSWIIFLCIQLYIINNLTEEIHSITAGIRSRELCQAPISASAFIPLAGVVGESLSFSTLQMQRRLRPDSNARLEATYRHSHLSSRLNERRHRGRHGSLSGNWKTFLKLQLVQKLKTK